MIRPRPKKKLTKREIKQDKLVTAYFKATDWLQANSRYVLYGVAGAAAVLLMILLVVRSHRVAEARAAVELARADLYVDGGRYEEAVGVLETIVEKYGGTSAARMALLDLADMYYRMGEFDLAVKYFDRYVKKHAGYDPLLTASALAGKAACLEGKGDYEGAAQLYVKAYEKAPKGFNAPEYLVQAAVCLERSGKLNQAKDLCQKVLDQFPKSTVRRDAETVLARIQVKQARASG
ncbi:MAG: tetratricopeptide repeat protein [candidate division KSB1 bacterium]|nr:tetratricopeptide repeat protein [candidate division KSB1 bacterium]